MKRIGIGAAELGIAIVAGSACSASAQDISDKPNIAIADVAITPRG